MYVDVASLVVLLPTKLGVEREEEEVRGDAEDLREVDDVGVGERVWEVERGEGVVCESDLGRVWVEFSDVL